MRVKVLVVDDSRFYINRLCEILATDPDIQVIGTAENGGEAIDKAVSLNPDVIIMDVEMPIMNGISAVREIMKIKPIPILMFSSLTTEGAKATLDAIDAGAVDFMLKRFEKLTANRADFNKDICSKVRLLASSSAASTRQFINRNHSNHRSLDARNIGGQSVRSIAPDHTTSGQSGQFKIVAIGASTGGPSAIQSILAALPGEFPIPVLVVQHMPAAFTGHFARRLDSLSKLSIKEAEDGDVLQPGNAYIAPGGKQTLVEEQAGRKILRIRDSDDSEQYRPSVDISLKSVSNIYGSSALAVILTGMGADGREGSSALKKGGSSVWAQDKQTCIVYGMPQAVVDAGLADRVLPISEIAQQLALV